MSQYYQSMWERDNQLVFEAYVWLYVFIVLFPSHPLTIKLYKRWARRQMACEERWGCQWDFRYAYQFGQDLFSEVTGV